MVWCVHTQWAHTHSSNYRHNPVVCVCVMHDSSPGLGVLEYIHGTLCETQKGLYRTGIPHTVRLRRGRHTTQRNGGVPYTVRAAICMVSPGPDDLMRNENRRGTFVYRHISGLWHILRVCD